jgi:hypothetical protein
VIRERQNGPILTMGYNCARRTLDRQLHLFVPHAARSENEEIGLGIIAF